MQLSHDVTSLKGSGVALAIGIVGAVWAGLGVTLAIGNALDVLWAVPRMDRPDYVHKRLRGLAILVVIGTAQILTTVVVTLARKGTIEPPVAGIASFGGSAAIDFAVFLTAFRVLTAADVTRPTGPSRGRPRHDQLARPADARRPLRRARRRAVERDLRSLRRGHRPALLAVAGRANSASSPPRSTSCWPSACGRGRSSAGSRRPTSERCAAPRRPSSATSASTSPSALTRLRNRRPEAQHDR